MDLAIRQADPAAEIRRLRDFDRRCFSPSDLFPSHYWRECEVWWMLVNGRRIGCCALQPHTGFREDLDPESDNPHEPGVLHIASTAILPRWRGRGFGHIWKSWQLAYAHTGGFHTLVATTRASNTPMRRLNERYGFEVIRIAKDYYGDPDEDALVMQWRIAAPTT